MFAYMNHLDTMCDHNPHPGDRRKVVAIPPPVDVKITVYILGEISVVTAKMRRFSNDPADELRSIQASSMAGETADRITAMLESAGMRVRLMTHSHSTHP